MKKNKFYKLLTGLFLILLVVAASFWIKGNILQGKISLGPNAPGTIDAKNMLNLGLLNKCVKTPVVVNQQNIGKEINLDYCKYLQLNNNFRLYFSYQKPVVIAYLVLEKNDGPYLVDARASETGPSQKIMNYECPSLNYSVKYSDESKLTIVISNTNVSDIVCATDFVGKENDFYVKSINNVNYYIDTKAFTDVSTRDDYLNKIVNNFPGVLNFVQNKLGFNLLLHKLNYIVVYDPASMGTSYASPGQIIDQKNVVVNAQDLKVFDGIGNTPHELIHVFFGNIFTTIGWFEEGLADYVSASYFNSSALTCTDTGWQIGQTYVPYSNFSIPAQYADYNNPLSYIAYYHSAQCFWVYIKDKHGDAGIKKITQSMNNYRKKIEKKAFVDNNGIWNIVRAKFITEIVNPALGADLLPLVKQRYSYVE